MAAKKRKSTSDGGRLVVSKHKKAFRDFEIVDRVEAGLVLKGSEVKSIREGSVNLKDSYIRPLRGELFLVGC
ncbi:MAG: SsrA-binding protein, partial [Bdellovibrionales bacterium]|nr:SsrA-binding protein [Bdellovibrionales bacterium]